MAIWLADIRTGHRADRGDLITIGNTADDFELLADCDWVVEVIIERLEPKQALMERLEAVCKPTAIISLL